MILTLVVHTVSTRSKMGVCVCSYLQKMTGAPPNCKPECLVSTDCSQNTACIQQECRDPCPGLCGNNSECRVTNHNPICTYKRGYQGDPVSSCTKIPITFEPVIAADPCNPTPCGQNSQCKDSGGVAACSCLPGYVGVPPNCRPECIIHSECPNDMACVGQKCRDSCPGACGTHAECSVIKHNAVCRCQQGYEGDPFSGCRRTTTSAPPRITTTPVKEDPCLPSPCGVNAVCRTRAGAAACTYITGHFGDPYLACRPECSVNSNCPPPTEASQILKCVDPCPGSPCGLNADCRVLNHIATCTCSTGFQGDPFTKCSRQPQTTKPVIAVDPCEPNPCGPNSIFPQAIGDHCRCNSQPQMIGSPPNCRPECVVNSE